MLKMLLQIILSSSNEKQIPHQAAALEVKLEAFGRSRYCRVQNNAVNAYKNKTRISKSSNETNTLRNDWNDVRIETVEVKLDPVFGSTPVRKCGKHYDEHTTDFRDKQLEKLTHFYRTIDVIVPHLKKKVANAQLSKQQRVKIAIVPLLPSYRPYWWYNQMKPFRNLI